MTLQRTEPHGPGLKNYLSEARKAPNRVTTGSTHISCRKHHDRAHWVPRAVPWLGARSQGKREAAGQPG